MIKDFLAKVRGYWAGLTGKEKIVIGVLYIVFIFVFYLFGLRGAGALTHIVNIAVLTLAYCAFVYLLRKALGRD